MIKLQTRELVLKWRKEGKTQQEMADLIGCNQSAISRLIVKYEQTGSIKNLPRSGRPTSLSKKILTKLKREFTRQAKAANKKFCSINIKQFGQIITKETNQNYSQRHIRRILHQLDFSRITPRSQHILNDPEKVKLFREEFKKNSKNSIWVMNL
jgi:transposase